MLGHLRGRSLASLERASGLHARERASAPAAHAAAATTAWGSPAEKSAFFSSPPSFLRDLPDAHLQRLDAGHFAVEDHLEYIANTMKRFYDDKVAVH